MTEIWKAFSRGIAMPGTWFIAGLVCAVWALFPPDAKLLGFAVFYLVMAGVLLVVKNWKEKSE